MLPNLGIQLRLLPGERASPSFYQKIVFCLSFLLLSTCSGFSLREVDRADDATDMSQVQTSENSYDESEVEAVNILMDLMQQNLIEKEILDTKMVIMKGMLEELTQEEAPSFDKNDRREKRLYRGRGMKRGRLDALIARLAEMSGGSRPYRVGLMRFGPGK